MGKSAHTAGEGFSAAVFLGPLPVSQFRSSRMSASPSPRALALEMEARMIFFTPSWTFARVGGRHILATVTGEIALVPTALKR